MRKLVLVVAIAGLVVAGTATAAGPKTYTERFTLPKPKHALVFELHVKIAGVSVKGTPFFMHVTNQPALPSYIRAAYEVFQTGPASWDVFVGINAPKGLIHARRLSGAGETMNVSLQVPPVGPGTVTVTGSTTEDACQKWLREHPSGFGSQTFYVLIAGSESEALAVMKFVREADEHCR